MLRLPRFIRRFFRRKMNPRTEEEAWSIKTKLSIAYSIIAWNAFGFVCYQVYKGNASWPVMMGLKSKEDEMVRPAIQYAHMLGYEKAHVYRISGLSISEEETLEMGKDKQYYKMFDKNGVLIDSGPRPGSNPPAPTNSSIKIDNNLLAKENADINTSSRNMEMEL